MRNNMLDLYTDYLITSTSYTTATGLSKVLDNRLSHDKVTRFLKEEKPDNHRLRTFIKPLVRSVEQLKRKSSKTKNELFSLLIT